MGSRIRWNPDEQTALINKAATLLVNRQTFSLREAFDKAQSDLPIDRQRQIAALTQIPWFTDSVPKRVKEIEHETHNGVQARIDAAVAKAKAESCETAKQELIRQGGQILAELIKVALEDPVIRNFFMGGPKGSHNPSAIKVNKTKLKRVIVAGSLNAQAHLLEKEFGEKLDLRFWSKDQSSDTLKAMLQQADAAVGMVGFLSHAHDNLLKQSKVLYIPVSGGVTQVKLSLQKLVD